ncbi:hypothetical protein [Chitinasiproducens palmae]|nr:hypothetical protein [Chitinasiproducens palmae]
MALRCVAPPFNATSCVAVPSHLLGRPVHQLAPFGEDLAGDIARVLAQRCANLPAHTFDVANMHLSDASDATDVAPNAVVVDTDLDGAQVRWRFDSDLLARLIDVRYGTAPVSALAAAAPPRRPDAPASGTARRLAQLLAEECVQALGRRLSYVPERATTLAYVLPPLGAKGTVSIDGAPVGAVSIELDTAAQVRLFSSLSGGPRDAELRQTGGHDHVGRRIALCMRAHVLDLRLSIAEILDLRPGQVVATSNPNVATVCIGEQALLRGRVHERAGKLCLTSLEFLE